MKNKNKNNVLDLSKTQKTKRSFLGFKKKKKFNSPPNLSFGVKVTSVKGSKNKKISSPRAGSGIRPRLLFKKKMKGIRKRDYDTADSSQEISEIWKRNEIRIQILLIKDIVAEKKPYL